MDMLNSMHFCNNPFRTTLHKEITFSEHEKISLEKSNDIIINDEYRDLDDFNKHDQDNSLLPSNKLNLIDVNSNNENSNSTVFTKFSSENLPHQDEHNELNLTVVKNKFHFTTLINSNKEEEDYERKHMRKQTAKVKFHKMRKYLFDNSF